MACLFKNGTLLRADGSLLEHAYVATEKGRIVWVENCPPPDKPWDEVIDAEALLLLPGLYNSHTHVAMTLMRGYGDDMPLDRWLNERIFPFEDRLNGEDVYWGSLLGIAEMLASGTVSFTDMYYFCDQIAAAVAESGIKANIGRGISCFDPTKSFRDLPAYGESVELLENWQGGADGRIRIDVAPHAEYTTRPDILADAADLAARYGARMHTHLSETAKEQSECIKRHGRTPALVMKEAGMLDLPITLAHCVWLTDPDMELLAAAPEVTIAHCIKSNLKLGSGIARVQNMQKKGLKVAIGTDSAASNNGLDMLEEMRTASLVAKGISCDPCLLPAKDVLEMSTRVGALGQGRKDGGDIALGYSADIVALDKRKISLNPSHNPLSNLLYAANASTVYLTMVDGRILYKKGEFTTLDMERIRYEVERRASALSRG